MQGGEAILLTFDLSGLALGAGESLVWTGANFLQITAEVWKQTGASEGTLVNTGIDLTGNITLSDGDTFALVNGAPSTAMRLRGMTLNVIPEPATLGIFSFAGVAILAIRRRVRK